MTQYYDDNFGCYDDDEEDCEEREMFYQDVQDRSVEKVCKGCGETVHIMAHYAYCNSCCEIMERGGDLG